MFAGKPARGVGDHAVVGPDREPVGVPVAHERLAGMRQAPPLVGVPELGQDLRRV